MWGSLSRGRWGDDSQWGAGQEEPSRDRNRDADFARNPFAAKEEELANRDGVNPAIRADMRASIMAVYYVASIAPSAYPAFYDLCDGRLPETFGEWRSSEDLTRRDLVARGNHVIGLPVELGGFRGHCRSMNCQADGAALTTFATRIGNGHLATYESDAAVGARTVVVNDTRAGPVVVEAVRAEPVILQEAPPRRHWWQLWRRKRFLEKRRPLAAGTA